MTHLSQVVQHAILQPLVREELPHALDHIIDDGQVEFGLQSFTDTESQKLLSRF